MSMFPHLSSLNTSSPFHVPSLTRRKLSSSSSALTCKCMKKDTPFSFNSGNRDRPLMISSNFVPFDPPSSLGPVQFDFQPPPQSISSVPFSIKFVQLRKKRSNLPLPKTPPPNLSPLGASVFSLASVISETQKLFFPNGSSSKDSSACTDTGYSIIWLHEKIFASSPAFTVGILSLMGEFVKSPLKSEIEWVVADLEWAKIVQEREPTELEEKEEEEKKFESWAEIGINMKDESQSIVGSDVIAMSDRKRITYERLIVCNEANSLVLSNYAQFLYVVQKDFDRAEEYFKRAVEAEPSDPEAMSRYAIFLWQEREDLEKAEEMFNRAVELESDNNHYISAYARFLWITGGTETCVE
ncbi:hypothetical protein LUZ60_014796 [Juncus effusus]|nr:hypothetical protein LUZ60_014796 [Juncus effusus]